MPTTGSSFDPMNGTEAALSLVRAKSLVKIDCTVVDDRGIAFGDLQRTIWAAKVLSC